MARSWLASALTFCTLTCPLINSVSPSPLVAGRDGRSFQDKSLMWNDLRITEGMNIQNGLIDKRYRWPDSIVYYQMDLNFSQAELDIIMEGMKDISSKTVITFKERTSEPDYVYVQRGEPGSGCYGYLGRIGGLQLLNLQAPSGAGAGHCIFRGTAAHEFIHAIGFFHEHVRPDRDRYVTINFDNVIPGEEHNFEKQDDSVATIFNVPYDYGSIMHYDAYTFAFNPNEPTISATRPGYINFGGDTVTPFDALKINRMYNGGELIEPLVLVELTMLAVGVFRFFQY